MNLFRVVKNLLWINTFVFLSISLWGVAIAGWFKFQLIFDTVTLNILNHHSPLADTFFKYYTQLAEWPVVTISVLFAIYQFREKSAYWLISFIIFGLVIQSLKLGFNFPRPILRFPEYIRQIDGMFTSSWKAFPSGHTANSVFATGLIIIAYSQNRQVTPFGLWIAFFFVLGIGFSRVYLGQHSTEDVVAGSAVGLLSLLISMKFESWGMQHIRFRSKLESKS